ncbi:dTMP kinase [Candidatus Bathyarchaeota archaeon]|nr:dTMP kinase [Candidatus Bathyarchaeota archaeon]
MNGLSLIVLEGIDKAGKDTQTRLLADSLRRAGMTVNCVSFPDYATPLGRDIKRFLAGKVCFGPEVRQLLYVANRWEREADIRSWLDDKHYVLADRYIPAGLVYGMVNGLDLDWMLHLEEGLPRADLVIVLDIPPERAVEREKARDIYEKDIEFQAKIRSTYLQLSAKFGWKVVDGNKAIPDVAADVLRLIKTLPIQANS